MTEDFITRDIQDADGFLFAPGAIFPAQQSFGTFPLVAGEAVVLHAAVESGGLVDEIGSTVFDGRWTAAVHQMALRGTPAPFANLVAISGIVANQASSSCAAINGSSTTAWTRFDRNRVHARRFVGRPARDFLTNGRFSRPGGVVQANSLGISDHLIMLIAKVSHFATEECSACIEANLAVERSGRGGALHVGARWRLLAPLTRSVARGEGAAFQPEAAFAPELQRRSDLERISRPCTVVPAHGQDRVEGALGLRAANFPAGRRRSRPSSV